MVHTVQSFIEPDHFLAVLEKIDLMVLAELMTPEQAEAVKQKLKAKQKAGKEASI